MDKVTDVFEFATLHPDYWSEFLTADEFGEELNDQEVAALTVAQEHLEHCIYQLLQMCGEQLEKKLKNKGVVSKRFHPAATARNRRVRIDAPLSLRDRLYRIEFALEPDDKAERVRLYAILAPKVAAFETLKARLLELDIKFEASGPLLYGPGIPLEKDKFLEELADRAAQSAGELLKCLE